MYSLFDLLDSMEAKKEEPKVEIMPASGIEQECSENAFRPDLVTWKENRFIPGLMLGEVIGIVPKDILSPLEGRKGSIQSAEWQEQQSIWSAFVYAVGGGLPRKERYETEWEQKGEFFKKARDEQQPIRLRINRRDCEKFRGLKVIEYLSDSEGGTSHD